MKVKEVFKEVFMGCNMTNAIANDEKVKDIYTMQKDSIEYTNIIENKLIRKRISNDVKKKYFMSDRDIVVYVKKPFKVARVITNGVIDGLAVGWATATGAKTCQKAVNSKMAKNIFKYVKEAIKTMKPLTGLALKGLEKIKGYAVKGLNILKNNKYGQKLTSLSDKLTNNSFTKKIINFTENISKKVVEIVKKVIKPIKNMTFEKATNITATTLGTGSGIAGAYVAAKEANPIQTVEDEE
jgi:hypothetical protein